MESIEVSGIVFACVIAGAVVGVLARRRLPHHHLCVDSREVVKLGLGLVATLTAMVLGLLIATAKGTFDAQSGAVKEFATKSILLDRGLAMYGSEAADARAELRRAVAVTTDRMWAENGGHLLGPVPGDPGHTLEGLYARIAALSPQTDAQRALKARALDVTSDLAHARLRLLTQQESPLPRLFFVVLVFWLALLFAGFALLGPAHGTVATVLALAAVSVSAAVFLTLELNAPYSGTIVVSSEPLHEALGVLGQ